MKGYYKQVADLLRQHGWALLRQGGTSHQIWGKGSNVVTLSTSCDSRHTANAVLKQAGIKAKL